MGLQRPVLLAEAAVTLSLFHVAVLTLPFSALRRMVAGAPKGTASRPRRVQIDTGSVETASQVTQAVAAVARRLPWRTTCLTDALAAHAMLKRRGCEAELRVGVRLSDATATRLVSHAWLECNGLVVLGQRENLDDYSVLT